MASLSADADAASRSSSSHPDAHRRPPAELVHLSAADCSIGDDSGAVAASSSLAAEPIATSSSSHLPPPPPPFEPLFALLTNTTTNTTVHPRVHYLFADDDASLPTTATTATSSHRSLVVDLAPTPDHDAWAVSCASSLGSAFAVTAAALSKQQAENSSSAAEPIAATSAPGAAAPALMLHVAGVSRDPVDLRASVEAGASGASLRSSAASAAVEDLEALADDFRRRMGVLKKVVGEGEKRRAVMAHHDRQDDAAAGSHEFHDPGALRSGTASQSHDVATATAAVASSS
ncbi:hypothetical protein A9K55_005249 [Cordyceps militaris]|uniref:Uncharacterized protein n=1 Tax=Cordyceps militaris TaxID=73501 RepID=A0A2H4SP91_CORMI|nr:hypothetical protein A9K55_005249 [Cordyceps militaris]